MACPESSLIDSREFLQPIITPFEFSLACNSAIKWSGRLVTDYRDLLGDLSLGEEEEVAGCDDSEDSEGDVSLITGKVRTASKLSDLSTEGQLTVINDKTISLVHEKGGGAFLAGRAWSGLEQKLGETEVKETVQGRKGIAAGYEGEGENHT